MGITRSVVRIDHSVACTDESIASTEHSVAGIEYSIAGFENSVAGTDESVAGIDHSVAGTDDSVASIDHSVAGSEHSVAGTDHSVEGTKSSVAPIRSFMDLTSTSGRAHERRFPATEREVVPISGWVLRTDGAQPLRSRVAILEVIGIISVGRLPPNGRHHEEDRCCSATRITRSARGVRIAAGG
jgi:hypothetical protein